MWLCADVAYEFNKIHFRDKLLSAADYNLVPVSGYLYFWIKCYGVCRISKCMY